MKTGKKYVSDQKKLQLIYENLQLQHLDYLTLENVENFNWKEFFMRFYLLENDYGGGILCESVELIKSDESGDEYEITVGNGSIFRFRINFISKQDFSDKILGLLTTNLSKRNQINNLINTLKETVKPVIHLIFEDELHNKVTTNRQSNYAYSVISGISKALQMHITSRMYFPDIAFFEIIKGDERKIELYQHFFEDYINPHLPNRLIDNKHSGKSDIYYWRTIE